MIVSRSILPLAIALAGCKPTEPAMSSPSPPPKPLSSFKQLSGGAAQAIAAGEPLAVLGGSLVTWWDGDSPVEVPLPSHVDPYGARWAADRKSLRVGLGAVDVATKVYRDEPALQPLNAIGPGAVFSARRTAWFGDGAHVAVVVEMRDPKGGRTTELAVADTGGRVRGRSKLPGMVTAITASQDRVLVDASRLVVLDLDAKVIAEPKLSALRINEGAGMFAITLTGGTGVALVRPADGSVVATWNLAANDAVPVPHGIVAVARDGTVHVGCVDGNTVKEVATAPSGADGPIVRLVGGQLVVAGGTVDPIHVAAFTNPCT
jgi:hypothetical protein